MSRPCADSWKFTVTSTTPTNTTNTQLVEHEPAVCRLLEVHCHQHNTNQHNQHTVMSDRKQLLQSQSHTVYIPTVFLSVLSSDWYCASRWSIFCTSYLELQSNTAVKTVTLFRQTAMEYFTDPRDTHSGFWVSCLVCLISVTSSNYRNMMMIMISIQFPPFTQDMIFLPNN